MGTGRNKCKKNAVWMIDHSELQDPFLLSGCKILSGSLWILVCLPSKPGSSKRTSSEFQLGAIIKLSNSNQQIKTVVRLVVLIIVIYLSLTWISGYTMTNYDIFLQLIYLISCLTVYLSYTNTSEYLWCLGKYLRRKMVGKGYKIMNNKLF